MIITCYYHRIKIESGTTERACTRRSCSQETRIPPLLHPIYTPQIDKAPQNRRMELLQPDTAANQVPICVRRSETVVLHAQAKHTHALTTHRRDTNSVPGYGMRSRQIIIRNKEVSHRRNNICHLQPQPTLHVCTEAAPLPRVTSDPPRRPVRSQEVDAGPK